MRAIFEESQRMWFLAFNLFTFLKWPPFWKMHAIFEKSASLRFLAYLLYTFLKWPPFWKKHAIFEKSASLRFFSYILYIFLKRPPFWKCTPFSKNRHACYFSPTSFLIGRHFEKCAPFSKNPRASDFGQHFVHLSKRAAILKNAHRFRKIGEPEIFGLPFVHLS